MYEHIIYQYFTIDHFLVFGLLGLTLSSNIHKVFIWENSIKYLVLREGFNKKIIYFFFLLFYKYFSRISLCSGRCVIKKVFFSGHAEYFLHFVWRSRPTSPTWYWTFPLKKLVVLRPPIPLQICGHKGRVFPLVYNQTIQPIRDTINPILVTGTSSSACALGIISIGKKGLPYYSLLGFSNNDT